VTAVEHMVAWIESSREHYERLCRLEIDRNKRSNKGLNVTYAREALSIVTSAYNEAVQGGDMFARDQSPATLLQAALALLEWELEQ
jgi:hypothetical protein